MWMFILMINCKTMCFGNKKFKEHPWQNANITKNFIFKAEGVDFYRALKKQK